MATAAFAKSNSSDCNSIPTNWALGTLIAKQRVAAPEPAPISKILSPFFAGTEAAIRIGSTATL